MSAVYFDYVQNLSLFSFCSTQKILHHARLAERGVIARDPMKEAIGLELDMLNIL
jgi:growth hormone-inducible transmembrane protein